jgi:Mg-chelatase subunit ChlD/type II secretory pathway pseudopilin PulG
MGGTGDPPVPAGDSPTDHEIFLRRPPMNPDNPQTPREQLEIRLTALLLGELSADESAELRAAIQNDPSLAELYHRLEETIHLVREAGPAPSAQSNPQPAALKLSDDRREKLLAQFKTVTPREFSRPQKRPHQRTRFDTLIEIAAVLVLVGVLAGMLLPALSKSKTRAMYAQRAPAKLAEVEEADKQPRDAFLPPPHQPKEEQLSRSDVEAKKGDEQIKPNLLEEIPIQSTNAVAYTPPAQTPKQEIFLPSSNETVEAPKELAQKVNIWGLSTAAGENTQTAATNIAFSGGTVGSMGGSGGGGAGGRGSNVGDPAWIGMIDHREAQQEAQHSASNQFVGRYAYTATPPGGIDPATGLPVGSVAPLNPNTGLPVTNVFGLATNYQVAATWNPATDLPVSNNYATKDFYRNTTSGKSNTRLPDATMFGSAGAVYPSGATGTTTIDGNQVPTFAQAEKPAPSQPGQSNDLQSDAAWRFSGHQPNVGWLGRVDKQRETLNADITNDGDLTSFGKLQKVPVLGDTPMLGAAFNSSNKSEVDAVMVTNGIALPQLAESDGKVSLGVQPESLAKSSPTEPTPNNALPVIPVRTLNPVSLSFDAENHQTTAAADDKSVSSIDQGIALKDKQQITDVTTGITTRQLAELKLAERKSAPVTESQLIAEDRSLPHPATPAAIPQPEVQTSNNAFSTFSLNVSDVSFKLAAASLEKGVMPDPATVRSEEFINAFDYRDPAPPPGAPIGFAWERSQDPFAQNRDLLRFSVQTAAAGREAGRPLNLVLLLDNSGSMERADRVQIIHEALRVLAAQLQPQDTLSVVTFARTPRLWVDGVPGSQAGDVAEKVSGLTPQGGTNLEDAMKLAYETALRHYLANGVNRVVLLTDGAANLGNVDPEALKQKVETNRKQGIALDCFGIGWEGYNDDLLEVLSRNGDGRYGFINTPEDAATGFAGQLAGALHVAAADVKVQVEFNPARVNSYRQIGYAKHQLTKQQFRDNSVDAAEIGAAESGNALYTVEVNPQGDGPLATVRVRYKVPATGEYREQAWPVPYNGASAPLDKSSPAMRLSATASEFSEWLASSPYATDVTPDQLLNYLGGVPEVYGADARPKKLEWMLRQAKSIGGK